MKPLFIFCFILLELMNFISSKSWTDTDLLNHLNSLYPNHDSLLFDDIQFLNSNETTHVSSLINEIKTKYKINIYLLLVEMLANSFDINIILSGFTYPSDTIKNNSIFAIMSKENKEALIASNENATQFYTKEYLDELQKEVSRGLSEDGPTYKNSHELLRGLRNKFIIPEGGWTPSNLISYLTSIKPIGDYGFYDPTLRATIETEEELIPIYNELSNRKIHTYIFLIENFNRKIYNSTQDFYDELFNEMTNKLPSSVNKNKSIIYLFMEKSIVNFTFGNSFKEFLDEEDINYINKGFSFIYNYTTLLNNLLKNIREVIGGEYLGWTPQILYNHLSTLEAKNLLTSKNYFYMYKSNNFNESEMTYINDLLSSLSDNGMNLFFFELNKMDSSYSSNITNFCNEFKSIYEPHSSLITDNIVYVFISKIDNFSPLISVGKNNKEIITNEIINQIYESFSKISKEEIFLGIKTIMKNLRFHRVIKDYNFTPINLYYYLLDEYGIQDYSLLDINNTLEQKEKEDITQLLDSIKKKHRASVYLMILKNVDNNYENRMSDFATELYNNISDFNRKTSINISLITVIYSVQYNQFGILPKPYSEKFPESLVKKIVSESAKREKIYEKNSIMLKYIDFYLNYGNVDWSGAMICDYFNNFIGKINYYLFDPADYLTELEKCNLKSYLDECENVNKNYLYFFILKKENQSDYYNNEQTDIMKHLIVNFKLPDGISIKDTLFITFNPYSKSFDFNIGENLLNKLTESKMNEIISEAIKKFDSSKPSEYEALKFFISNIRLNLINNRKWTSTILNDFLTKNYPKSILEKYFIFDYLTQLTEKEINDINTSYLDIFYDKFYLTSTFIFVVDKIDESENINLVLEHLYSIESFSEKKENLLLILYSFSDNQIKGYSGTNTRNYLTLPNLDDISLISSSKLETSPFNGIVDILNSCKTYLGYPLYYDPENLIEQIKVNYTTIPNFLIYDIHKEISNKNLTELNNQCLNIIFNKNTYIYAFIVNKISTNENDINSYLKTIVQLFPVPDLIKSEKIVFVIYSVYEKKIGLIAENDNNKVFKQDNINEIIQKSIPFFNDNVYEGMNKLLYEIDNKLSGGKNKSSSKFWKIFFSILISIFILALLVLIYLRIKSKNSHSSETIITCKNADNKPLFSKDNELI